MFLVKHSETTTSYAPYLIDPPYINENQKPNIKVLLCSYTITISEVYV